MGQYTLRPGVLLQAFGDESKTCTNDNLTDELAEYHLKKCPDNAKYFSRMPGGPAPAPVNITIIPPVLPPPKVDIVPPVVRTDEIILDVIPEVIPEEIPPIIIPQKKKVAATKNKK